MAEKRKHEDNLSPAVQPKKFKKNKTYPQKMKKVMKETQSTSNNTESAASPTKKQKPTRSSNSKQFQHMPKVSDENINSEITVKHKMVKKKKMWKHWDRKKKHNKSEDKDSKPKQDSSLKGSETKQEATTTFKSTEMKKPIETVSCNWKKLKMDMKKTKPRKKLKKKPLSKQDQIKTDKKETESMGPDIWFDDVDEELLKPKKDTQASKLAKEKILSRPCKSADDLVKEHSFKGLTKAVALDCEMVGVGEGGQESVLARVSIVNQFGECLYDTFVRSREDVVDYRTKWSGVTPEKLENAADFLDAQKAVSDILQGRILVGHAVHHDLKVLFLDHPHKDIRDTSHYKPYRQMFKGRTPSLKNLTSRLLNVKIQTGEHNSVTDAQAAMRLYTFSRKEWEGHLKKRKIRKKKSTKTDKTKQ